MKIADVDKYTSNPHGPVNTWWIETGEGIVIIDAQRAIHEAKLAVEAIKAAGRPVLAILVTHLHSDHVGGLPVFREVFGENVPIFADLTTIEHLKHDPMGDLAFTKQLLGPDFPDHMTIPDRVLKDGDLLRFGKLTFHVQVIGYCEAPSMAMYYLPEQRKLFSGDLVTNQHTPWLVEGHTSDWLNYLERAKADFPEDLTVYPGHGSPGTHSLFDDESAYIQAFRETVRSYGDGSSQLDYNDLAKLVEQLSERFPPDYSLRPVVADLTNQMFLNVVGVARETARLQKTENPFELP